MAFEYSAAGSHPARLSVDLVIQSVFVNAFDVCDYTTTCFSCQEFFEILSFCTFSGKKFCWYQYTIFFVVVQEDFAKRIAAGSLLGTHNCRRDISSMKILKKSRNFVTNCVFFRLIG